jgi:hypothetical protein
MYCIRFLICSSELTPKSCLGGGGGGSMFTGLARKIGKLIFWLNITSLEEEGMEVM